jgi:hypothetical protein
MSQSSTAGLAKPTPRVASGAEVLALHLSNASVIANPYKTTLTQPANLVDVHLVQSVAHFLH